MPVRGQMLQAAACPETSRMPKRVLVPRLARAYLANWGPKALARLARPGVCLAIWEGRRHKHRHNP